MSTTMLYALHHSYLILIITHNMSARPKRRQWSASRLWRREAEYTAIPPSPGECNFLDFRFLDFREGRVYYVNFRPFFSKSQMREL